MAGLFVGSDISPKRYDAIALRDEVGGRRGESIPIVRDPNEKVLEYGFGAVPGAGVIRKALGFRPFDVLVERGEDTGHVATLERIVETSDDIDRAGHRLHS